MSERPRPIYHESICNTSDKKDTKKLSKEEEIELIAIEKANAYINEKIAILENNPVVIKIINTKLDFKEQYEECKKKYDDSKKIGVLLEYIIHVLNENQKWFGEKVSLSPTTKYDDIFNHLDGFLYQPQLSNVEDKDRIIGLSFDYTFSKDGGQDSKKNSGIIGKFIRIIYGEEPGTLGQKEKRYQKEKGLINGHGGTLSLTPRQEQENLPQLIIGSKFKDIKDISYYLLDLTDGNQPIENEIKSKIKKMQIKVLDETFFGIQAYIHFLQSLLLAKGDELNEYNEFESTNENEAQNKIDKIQKIKAIIENAKQLLDNFEHIFHFLQTIIIEQAQKLKDKKTLIDEYEAGKLISRYFVVQENSPSTSSLRYHNKSLKPLDIGRDIFTVNEEDLERQAIRQALTKKNLGSTIYTEQDLTDAEINYAKKNLQRNKIESTNTSHYEFSPAFLESRNGLEQDDIYKLIMTKLHQVATYE